MSANTFAKEVVSQRTASKRNGSRSSAVRLQIMIDDLRERVGPKSGKRLHGRYDVSGHWTRVHRLHLPAGPSRVSISRPRRIHCTAVELLRGACQGRMRRMRRISQNANVPLLEGVKFVQSVSWMYEERATLTVPESSPSNVRYRMFHSRGMYMMYTHSARDALRETPGDRHTYRT